MRSLLLINLSVLAGLISFASAARAEQTAADRADPSVVEEELRRDTPLPPVQTQPLLNAPQAQESGTAVTEPVLVGAILVEGAEALPQSAFGRVVERYAGRSLSVQELRGLAADVATVARDAGYGLATAWIPQQRLDNGLLRVRLEEGRIDGVEVAGDAREAVLSRLLVLAHGKPITTAELERQLLLAGDLPGVRMGKARLERRNGRNILIVATAFDRVAGRASLDNWGSSTAGPVRARASLDVNRLLAADDSLAIDTLITPFQPKEFALLAGRYTAAAGNRGTEISIDGYYARSEAGGELADRDFDGRSREIQLLLRHPLRRSREASIWASLAGRVRESEQTRDDLLIREDRLSIVAGDLYGYRRYATGRVRGRATVSQGLDLFGANRRNDALGSRGDAGGVFTKLEMWGEVEQQLGGAFSLLVQAEGQLADGPLLSSEEMGLGGRRFGRGWDYREFSGDRGIAGAIELRHDFKKVTPLVENAQVYGYADAGTVDNYRLGSGGGSLASAGGGLRLWLKSSLRASAELGVPLTRGDASGRSSNPRLSLTLDARF